MLYFGKIFPPRPLGNDDLRCIPEPKDFIILVVTGTGWGEHSNLYWHKTSAAGGRVSEIRIPRLLRPQCKISWAKSHHACRFTAKMAPRKKNFAHWTHLKIASFRTQNSWHTTLQMPVEFVKIFKSKHRKYIDTGYPCHIIFPNRRRYSEI